MTSNYQIWISYNSNKEKLRLPVNPESIKIESGSNNDLIKIPDFGEVVIKQARPAWNISFSSFFPSLYFQGVLYKNFPSPQACIEKLEKWRDGTQPVKLMITGTTINTYCTIESFSYEEKGGDVGTCYYSIKFREFKKVTVKKIKVKGLNAKIAGTNARLNSSSNSKTYKVKKGDCLYNIAKSLLGDGGRYMEIYKLNKDKLKDPNVLKIGQVLTLP